MISHCHRSVLVWSPCQTTDSFCYSIQWYIVIRFMALQQTNLEREKKIDNGIESKLIIWHPIWREFSHLSRYLSGFLLLSDITDGQHDTAIESKEPNPERSRDNSQLRNIRFELLIIRHLRLIRLKGAGNVFGFKLLPLNTQFVHVCVYKYITLKWAHNYH